jgi:hypothetical protein
MIKPKFSKWVPWADRGSLEGLKFPGVYALAISERDLAGEDFDWQKEIVYFGMTNSIAGLRGRLKQFENTIIGKSGHGGAERFLYKYKKYKKLSVQLFVSVSPVTCDVRSNQPADLLKMGDVAKLEFVCFAEYAKRFEEIPEFNDKLRSPKKEK